MAKALKCDRCGGFYDYIKALRKYQIHDMDKENFNKTIDLCPDCYGRLIDFLDEIKNQDLIGSGGWDNSYYDEFEEEDGGSSST